MLICNVTAIKSAAVPGCMLATSSILLEMMMEQQQI